MSDVNVCINDLFPGQDEYEYLYNCIENIRIAKNSNEINRELDTIKRIFSRTLDMDCTFTILDTSRDVYFFGLNVFPDTSVCLQLVDLILDSDSRNLDQVKIVWNANKKWHIDFDIKLFKEVSKSLTTHQIISLILFKIEHTCFNTDIIELIYRTIRRGLLQLPYIANKIVKASICRNLYIIPFIRACSYTNFLTEVPEYSLLRSCESIHNIYKDTLMRLIKYYGTTDLIDRNPIELVYNLQYNLEWIFEALNDLKYRMGLLKKNIKEQILAEKSVHVKNLLVSIYKTFASYDNPSLVNEATYKGNNVSPKMLEMQDKLVMERFVKRLTAVKENHSNDFIDSLGRAKKISQQDIDVLRVECESINSIDDKTYYLHRCYKLMSVVDNSLSLLEDKELAKKVTQPKNVLVRQKEQLMNIRNHIINAPLTVKKYGVFIEYPEHYKG